MVWNAQGHKFKGGEANMHVQSNGGWLGGWLGGSLAGWHRPAGQPNPPPLRWLAQLQCTLHHACKGEPGNTHSLPITMMMCVHENPSLLALKVSWTRGDAGGGGAGGGRGEDMKLAVFKRHTCATILGDLAKHMPCQALPSFSTTQKSTGWLFGLQPSTTYATTSLVSTAGRYASIWKGYFSACNLMT